MASNPRFNPDDPLELAAARMTRFLASKPRHPKTRAYLATLPKRKRIVVKPEDYPLPVSRAAARLNVVAQLIRDAQRYADWEARGKPPSPTAPRKDRRRPRAVQLSNQLPMRERLYAAQAGNCGLCGRRMHEASEGTLDHVVPRSRGGQNAGNLLLAHERCNNAKANRMPTQEEMEILAAVNVLLSDSDTRPKDGDAKQGSARE
jgi:5-methylcytosine-specific restriction endonuclease McrA